MSFFAVERSRDQEAISHHFLLFIAGSEPNSMAALQNLQALCNGALAGRYELEVVDVFTAYETALAHRVLVTPCVVMVAPPPRVMVAGTLGDAEKVRAALRLEEE